MSSGDISLLEVQSDDISDSGDKLDNVVMDEACQLTLSVPDSSLDPRQSPDHFDMTTSLHNTRITDKARHLGKVEMATCMGRMEGCENVYLLPTRLATVALALIQGIVLDCYLSHYNSSYWLAWLAGDVAVLMIFVVAFVISYREMKVIMNRLLGSNHITSTSRLSRQSTQRERIVMSPTGACCIGGLSVAGMACAPETGIKDMDDGGEDLVQSPGSMPLAYFAWLVYASMLAIRVLLIYRNFARQLDQSTIFGPSTLQVTVAASSLVFMLMLLAHHDAIPCSRRRQRIDELTFLVPFDLIDASDLLGALTIPTAHGEMPVWAAWWVLGIACFNLLMPTLPLMALSRTQFGAHQLPEFLHTLHRLLVLLAVNLPLLITRLFLWQHQLLPVSALLMKNVAVCFLVLYSFYERDHHQFILHHCHLLHHPRDNGDTG